MDDILDIAPPRSAALASVALAVALIVACDGPATPPPTSPPPSAPAVPVTPQSPTTPPVPAVPPTLRFVSGEEVADTIEATITQPLVVEYKGEGGQPVNGARIEVRPIGVDVRLGASASGPFDSVATLTTDTAGRASLWTRFGRTAGLATISARVSGSGSLESSRQLTVLPGRTVRIVLAPRDTAVVIGGDYQMTFYQLDRAGNTSRANATLTSSAATVASVTTSGTTGRVAGVSFGRAVITATLGGFRDSVQVSVVPAGTLAALAYGVFEGTTGDVGVYSMRTDGSEGRWLWRVTSRGSSPTEFGPWPTWSPDGAEVAFIVGSRLNTVRFPDGAPHEITPADVVVSNQYGPQYSADGWLYFTRGIFGSQHTFWRVRPDGSGLVQVSEARSWGLEVMPSPNPRASSVAYQTNDVTNSPIDFTLRLIDPSTGIIRKLDIRGSSPRWSPLGDRIAYLGASGILSFLSPTGTSVGAAGSATANSGFSWSPDGAWIVTGAGNLRIINVSTGASVALPFRGPAALGLAQPSWRPTAP